MIKMENMLNCSARYDARVAACCAAAELGVRRATYRNIRRKNYTPAPEIYRRLAIGNAIATPRIAPAALTLRGDRRLLAANRAAHARTDFQESGAWRARYI
jgi:hypothetical protein